MRSPNEPSRLGFTIHVACGVFCALLLGIIIWQPKAGTWIAEAVEAESSKTSGEPELARPVAALARKPIGSTAWTLGVDPRQ